jgi:small subunit ribosomal protein S8
MDHIANFIVALKNANVVGKEKVFFPYSKLIFSVAELLKKEGYLKAVKDIQKDENPANRFLEIVLSYNGNNPKIREVARVSKTSKRIYKGVKEIGNFKQGKGLIILSTPKGILTDKEARKEHVGGEVLFTLF